MGNLTSASNDDAVVTRKYDSLGNLLEDSVLFDGDAATLTSSATYNDLGNLLSLEYPGGRTVSQGYDSLDRLSTISAGGAVASYDYVGVGRVEKLTLGNSTWKVFTYDDLMRPTAVTHQGTLAGEIDLRAFAYDAVHNRTQRSETRSGSVGRVYDYGYDDLSRLTSSTRAAAGADTLSQVYTLTNVGNRTNVRVEEGDDPAVDLAYAADAALHAYETTPFELGRAYDDNGNLTLLDGGGGALDVAFTYNHLNQMVERAPSGAAADYVYDALGRRIAKTVGGVTTRYLYFGSRVVEERDDSAATGTFATTATYVYGRYVDEVLQMQRGGSTYYYHADDQYNVFALTDATGAVVERYDYGDFGEPEFYDATGTSLATYDYVGVGQVEKLTLGNSTWKVFAYDDLMRPTAVTHQGTLAGEIDLRAFAYDAVHNRTQRSDTRTGGPGRVYDYGYDDLSRLTSSTRTAPDADTLSQVYTLTNVGNRTNVRVEDGDDPAVDLAYAADADLHAYETTPFELGRAYDDNGNLTLLDGGGGALDVGFTYNHRNQMVERATTTATADYVYDALGRRIAKTFTGTTTRYLYFGSRVVEERDDSAVTGTFATTATYVYGRYVDEVLQMQRDGSTYYYHADDQYNVFALTDATGAVVERYDYGDFGEPEFYDASGTTLGGTAYGNPYLFTCRRYDPESGFYYYRARYYDPRVGQFTTRDPLGVWGDPLNLGNPYAYVGNSPWSLVDPWGLCGEGAHGDARWDPLSVEGMLEALFGGMPLPDITTVGTGSGEYALFDWFYPGAAAMFEFHESLRLSRLAGNSFGFLGIDHIAQARELEGAYPGIATATWGLDMASNVALLAAGLEPAVRGGVAAIRSAGGLRNAVGGALRAGRGWIDDAGRGIRGWFLRGSTGASGTGSSLVPVGAKPLGQWGEARLSQVLGGRGIRPRRPFMTSDGPRYIDRLLHGVGHEAKAGVNVGVTSTIERQALKDAELVQRGQLRGAHWHFFQGAKQELLDFLVQHGIRYTIH